MITLMKALILNCTLKPTPESSNTDILCQKAAAEFEKLGVTTTILRPVDYNLLPGVASHMGEGDEWQKILDQILDVEIVVIASPIWVGQLGSVAKRVIERLNAIFHEKELSDPKTGQFLVYNKVAGALVTGNEDGAHYAIMNILWSMEEFGFTIPPNVNAYWVGVAGPGPSYAEAGGDRHLYTNKTYKVMVHNLVYFAELLKEHPIPTDMLKIEEEAKKESDEKSS